MIYSEDEKYISSIKKQAETLSAIYTELDNSYEFNLNSTELTESIIFRLKAYYETQNQIKSLLNKRYLSAASDFFVEQALFYIKLFLNQNRKELEVHSERQIRPKRGMIRPDISIWNKNSEVIGIIECKTQLGWNRHGWKKDFLLREEKLKNEFPTAKAYLLVMTTLNWGGFDNTDNEIGRKYFSLLKDQWPDQANRENFIKLIHTPFERLLKEIKNL